MGIPFNGVSIFRFAVTGVVFQVLMTNQYALVAQPVVSDFEPAIFQIAKDEELAAMAGLSVDERQKVLAIHDEWKVEFEKAVSSDMSRRDYAMIAERLLRFDELAKKILSEQTEHNIELISELSSSMDSVVRNLFEIDHVEGLIYSRQQRSCIRNAKELYYLQGIMWIDEVLKTDVGVNRRKRLVDDFQAEWVEIALSVFRLILSDEQVMTARRSSYQAILTGGFGVGFFKRSEVMRDMGLSDKLANELDQMFAKNFSARISKASHISTHEIMQDAISRLSEAQRRQLLQLIDLEWLSKNESK